MKNGNTIIKAILMVLFMMIGLLLQSVRPVINPEYLVDINVSVYKFFTEFHYKYISDLFKFDSTFNESPKITVIKIGDSENKSSYVQLPKLFDRLQEAGRPWVISFLNHDYIGNDLIAEKLLARLFKQYERVIMTPYKLISNSDIYESSTKEFLPLAIKRAIFHNKSSENIDIPIFPIEVLSPVRLILNAQNAGIYPIVATDGSRCLTPYLKSEDTRFFLANSLVLLAAYARKSTLVASNRSFWPKDLVEQITRKDLLHLGEQICLPNPEMSISEFKENHEIFSLGFNDFVDGKFKDIQGKNVDYAKMFKDHIIMLVPEEATRQVSQEDYDLYSMYLYSLLDNNFLVRQANGQAIFSYLPLLLAMILILSVAVLKSTQIFQLLLGIYLLIILYSYVLINFYHRFNVPVETIIFLAFAIVVHFFYQTLLEKFLEIRFRKVARNIRARLGQCNTLTQLKKGVENIYSSQFSLFEIEFQDYDVDLHQASEDLQIAIEFTKRILTRPSKIDRNLESSKYSVSHQILDSENISTVVSSAGSNDIFQFSKREFSTKLAVAVDYERLGVARVRLIYDPFEEKFLKNVLNLLQEDLSLHWMRIDSLARSKLKAFDYLMDSTALASLKKFLPQQMLNHFSKDLTIDKNLENVLAGKFAKTAILFIGFIYDETKFKKSFRKIDDVLNDLYGEIVDEWGRIAHAKIFADRLVFIVDESFINSKEVSASDVILAIASSVIERLKKNNENLEKDYALELTMVGHYANMVIGNLLGRGKIDYSVSGVHLNNCEKLLRDLDVLRENFPIPLYVFSVHLIADLRLFSEIKWTEMPPEVELSGDFLTSFGRLSILEGKNAHDLHSDPRLKNL